MKNKRFEKWIVWNIVVLTIIIIINLTYFLCNGDSMFGLLLAVVVLLFGWLFGLLLIIDILIGINLFLDKVKINQTDKKPYSKLFRMWSIINIGTITLLILETPMVLITQNILGGHYIFANLFSGWKYELGNMANYVIKHLIPLICILVIDITVGILLYKRNRKRKEQN